MFCNINQKKLRAYSHLQLSTLNSQPSTTPHSILPLPSPNWSLRNRQQIPLTNSPASGGFPAVPPCTPPSLPTPHRHNRNYPKPDAVIIPSPLP